VGESGNSAGKIAGGENGRPPARAGELVLVCGGSEFCEDARRELQRRRSDLWVASAERVESARRLIGEHTPAVILVEEQALAGGADSLAARRQAISAAVSLLAGYAPVVWIGGGEQGGELSLSLRFVEVDFVPRSALCLPAAITMVERRLRRSASVARARDAGQPAAASLVEMGLDERDFGELLRHELNNPLTGILGNAELLLLEVRRGKLELPPQTRQRLETITSLAVRMRETVRQLSDRWEGAGGGLSAVKEHGAEQPR
jgi:signal transduction histidine kinase